MSHPVTEHVVRTARHTCFYLNCGHPDATLLIFVHGWPELSISWRHQLPVFASLGFSLHRARHAGLWTIERLHATRGLRGGTQRRRHD